MNELKHYSQCALMTLLTGLVFIGIVKLSIVFMENSALPYVKAENMLYPNMIEGGYYCDIGLLQDPNGRTILDDEGKPISCIIVHLTAEELINY